MSEQLTMSGFFDDKRKMELDILKTIHDFEIKYTIQVENISLTNSQSMDGKKRTFLVRSKVDL